MSGTFPKNNPDELDEVSPYENLSLEQALEEETVKELFSHLNTNLSGQLIFINAVKQRSAIKLKVQDKVSGLIINIIGTTGIEIFLNDFIDVQQIKLEGDGLKDEPGFTIANRMRLPSGLPSKPMEAISVINDIYAQYAALSEGPTSFGARTIIKIYKFVARRKLDFPGVDKIQIFNSTSTAVVKLVKDLRSISRALQE